MARTLSLFPSPHRQTPTDSHAETHTMVQALVNRKSNPDIQTSFMMLVTTEITKLQTLHQPVELCSQI